MKKNEKRPGKNGKACS